MILVTGGTGRVGRQVVAQLRRRGTAFRVLSRDPARAREVLGDVDVVAGDLDQPDSLDPALAGVERVFLLSPGAPNQVEQEGNVLAASLWTGVRHIVKQSVMGASLQSPSALVRWHAEAEQLIVSSGIPFTFLRPAMLMQLAAELVGPDGAIYSSVGDARVAFVDARDVAAVAVAALTTDAHEWKTYGLTGPERLTWSEVAERLSRAGSPVRYVPVPEEAARQSMAQRLPAWRVEPTLEFNREVAGGLYDVVTGDVESVTGRPPRSFDDFVVDLAAAA